VVSARFALAQAPTAVDPAVVVERENVVDAQARGLAWKPATVGLPLALRDRLRTGEFSRAAVRFTDLSMLRVDELTTIEISPPISAGGRQTLDVKRGGTYFFSRDKTQEIEIRTPAANGALRGTEFELRVAANGRTRLTMFDGEVELGNAHGSVRLRSGEQAEVEVGRAPRKTAVIEAINIIQWCLYYPAVIDPAELGLASGGSMESSLAAYRAGDLPGALKAQAGKHAARTTGERLFRASVILSSGQVDKARAALAGVPTSDSRRQAIEQMIAAVKFQPWPRAGEPRTSSEWMAESYYQQSRSNLEAALAAARKATELSPQFGYAWARVAELEFSFGRTMIAMKVLERALELSPRNAQAHSLQGFLLSAENRVGAARRSFDTAIELDGALGNAWLGRGLTQIRQNHESEGRRDLQTAAVLEPNRSILRSYLGKAFSQVGINGKANLEFERAKELDPKDPTPWLYSAIQRKQENRYNEAIDDLEKSVELNDNRRVYRSEFLLDQDRAVRGTNLAAIYQKNGMPEQSVREAVRAVDNDYASAGAHLFLANSFNGLRDPARIQLRYETPWYNELLLAQLLSPVGGGPLSQFVSDQEYSKLFEKNGLGISSITEYLSSGDVREIGSQYGTFGNLSYALDVDYQYSDGVRPNNRLERMETYGSFKLQLSPQDTIFFRAEWQRQRNGDVFQHYDPSEVGSFTVVTRGENGEPVRTKVPNLAGLTYSAKESQDPGILLLGWHHEWSPGNHTLLLLGRLADHQEVSDLSSGSTVLVRDVTGMTPLDLPVDDVSEEGFPGPLLRARSRSLAGRGPIQSYTPVTFDLDYETNFEANSAELQNIFTLGPDTVVVGGRYQRGEFDAQVALSNYNNGATPDEVLFFESPTTRQNVTVDFERVNVYLYNFLRVTRWLSLTGGVTYDQLQYPDNILRPPLRDRQRELEQWSPKVALVLEPWKGSVLRAAYAKSISGASFDESVRLEPTQIAGFLQGSRSFASESVVGSALGSEYQTYGLSFEQKLPTRTYFGVQYDLRTQDFDRTLGTFDNLGNFGSILGIFPSSLVERDYYREDILTASLNQLVGTRWSMGARYRYTHSRLRQETPGLTESIQVGIANPNPEQGSFLSASNLTDLARRADRKTVSDLHELAFRLNYNDPSGFFLSGEANLYVQQNDRYVVNAVSRDPDGIRVLDPKFTTQNIGLPGAEFWQFNLMAGYRFYRNQCELSCGVLNLTDQDYQLSPLNPYFELPRSRTLVVRCKLTF
jgi:tetratricopeptide (TPR) repeat protein